MTEDDCKSWLERYRAAWETRDPAAVVELFSENALYQENPYHEPMRGRAAVGEYWENVRRTQDDVRFRSELLAVTLDTGIAHWWASFLRVPSGKRVHLDGVAAFTLDDEGRCRLFREWWHRREA